YVAIFISGFARGFLGPAQFSILPLTLPDKILYKNAVSWNSTIWQTSQVLGPVLGGYLYAWFGLKFAYMADIALLFGSLIVFFSLKLFQNENPKNENKQSVFQSMKEGITFIKNKQEILGAMTLDLFAVLFGGAVALLPIFAEEILNVGAKGLGYLRMAPALGSILMMVFITYFPIKRGAGKIMIISVACFGVCMIGFALSKLFFLSLALLAMSGAFDAVSVVVRQTLMQTLTPDHLKGRVSSVNNIFVGSSNEIGSFESGMAARLLGLVPSVVFGGCMTILIATIAYFKADKLRKINF
ncbi:MAG: MFS transporter, partial [Cytophagales bacterium]